VSGLVKRCVANMARYRGADGVRRSRAEWDEVVESNAVLARNRVPLSHFEPGYEGSMS